MEAENVEPAFSVQLSKPVINENYRIQAEFIMGRIAGQNSFSSFCDNPHHTIEGIPVQHKSIGEEFNAEFMESVDYKENTLKACTNACNIVTGSADWRKHDTKVDL